MFCPECGTKLPENAKFCPKCGRAAEIYEVQVSGREDMSSESSSEQDTQETMQCPRCGGTHCKEHYKQNVTSTGGGYGCLQGGLGYLLAGPFGLLCGLCGRSTKTTTTNTLVWVCQSCGHEFRSPEDVWENIRRTTKGMFRMLTVVGIVAVLMELCGVGIENVLMLWAIALIFSGICGYGAYMFPQKEFGLHITEFLSDEDKQYLKDSVKGWAIATCVLAVLTIILLIV